MKPDEDEFDNRL